MGGEMDKGVGHAKEAVGDLTGDKDMQAEGETQQTSGKVKDAGEKIKDSFDNVGEKLKGD